ncbi:MAG: hypothetical protein ACXVCY_13390 [Pseudobdellovibrionaceae bacterium]
MKIDSESLIKSKVEPLFLFLKNLGYEKSDEFFQTKDAVYQGTFKNENLKIEGSIICISIGNTGLCALGLNLKATNLKNSRFDLTSYLTIKKMMADAKGLIFSCKTAEELSAEIENASLHLLNIMRTEILPILDGRLWIEITEDSRG